MKQLSLPGMPPPSLITNVASVPHRSPFRYPGGKTWLVPGIRQWFASFSAQPDKMIEPFAGGAILGLTVAFEELAKHVTLVELDERVAAVWQTIIKDSAGEWLAHQINEFELTSENVDALLGQDEPSTRTKALQTIVANRVNRGGILAPGAGRLKHGENGKGIASRWYPQTLAKRILDIVAIRDKLTFIHGDGLEVLRQKKESHNVVFFIDPPYTAAGKKAGKRLYYHSNIDHNALFSLACTLNGDFVMTYDNNPEIIELADRHNLDTEPVAMKNAHHAKMTELVIGRDLSWLRSRTSP